MESYVEDAKDAEKTRKAKTLLGKRAIARSGDVLGKISEVRIDLKNRALEGVVVRHGLLRKKVYVCTTYIERVTEEAVMLNIDPAILYKGRAVVSKDGKKVGRVADITRDGHTNDIESVTVRKKLFWKIHIPREDFARLGTSLILKKTYDQAKQY